MEVTPAWRFFVGLGDVEHRTKALVESGPQYVTTRIPESWTVKSDGVPRAGYSRLPADYAYIDYVEAVVRKHIAESMPGATGRVVDLFA